MASGMHSICNRERRIVNLNNLSLIHWNQSIITKEICSLLVKVKYVGISSEHPSEVQLVEAELQNKRNSCKHIYMYFSETLPFKSFTEICWIQKHTNYCFVSCLKVFMIKKNCRASEVYIYNVLRNKGIQLQIMFSQHLYLDIYKHFLIIRNNTWVLTKYFIYN